MFGRFGNLRALFVALMLVGATFAFKATALTTTYTNGTGSGDFNTAGNWNNGVPGAGDIGIVNNLNVNLSGSVTVGNLQVANGTISVSAAATTLTINNGTFNNTTFNGFGVLILNGTVTFDGTSVLDVFTSTTVNGALTVNTGVLTSNRALAVPSGGSITGSIANGGVFKHQSSTLTTAGTGFLAGNIATGTNATYQFNNAQNLVGSLTCDNQSVTFNGTGSLTITGTLNMRTGSTVAIPLTVTSTTTFESGVNGAGNMSVISSKAVTFNGPLVMKKDTSINIAVNSSITCTNTASLTDIAGFDGNGDFILSANAVLTSNNVFNLVNNFFITLNNQGTINVPSGELIGRNGIVTAGSINGNGGIFSINTGNIAVSGTAILSGSIKMVTNGTLTINKTLSMTGTLIFDNQPAGLAGTGALTVIGAVNVKASANCTLASLIIPTGSTMTFSTGVNGAGFLSINSGAITCNGTLAMNQNTGFNLASGVTFACTGAVTMDRMGGIGGQGTFDLSSTASLTSTNPSGTNSINSFVTNAGAITSQTGILRMDAYTQSAGTLSMVGGNLQGGFTINGGTLSGAGTITGSVTSAGNVSPGVPGQGGGTAGTMTITSNYTQTANGTLNVKLGGTAAGTFDVLAIGGKGTFAGTLAITTLNSFAPAAADTFKIVTQTSTAGTFSTVNAGTTGLSPTISATAVTLAVGAPNPAPTLTSISPSSALVGGAAFTLTATGTNFVATSVVQFNGSPRTTTFVSATGLTAAITAADIATAGTANITVVTPIPGGGTSAAVPLTISTVVTNPAPTLSSISPTTIVAGSAAFTLTATGSNFISSSVINFNGSPRTTTFVSGTSLTAAISATDIASSGSASITVVTPTPGGGTSSAVTLTVTPGGAGGGTGTLSFTSDLSSSLNPSTVGDAVTFTAAGKDSGGGSVGYAWDFGDSTTAFGASVKHTYTAAGLYSVSCKLSNSTTSITSSLVQAVNKAGTGGTVGTLSLTKGSITFNFKTKLDTLVVLGTIPIPTGFAPKDKTVIFQLGDLDPLTFTLTEKGVSSGDKSATLKFAGKLTKGVFSTTTATFTLTIKKKPLFAGLTDFGFDNDDIPKPGDDVDVPYAVSVDGTSFVDVLTFNYTAKKDKSGTAKLVPLTK